MRVQRKDGGVTVEVKQDMAGEGGEGGIQEMAQRRREGHGEGVHVVEAYVVEADGTEEITVGVVGEMAQCE